VIHTFAVGRVGSRRGAPRARRAEGVARDGGVLGIGVPAGAAAEKIRGVEDRGADRREGMVSRAAGLIARRIVGPVGELRGGAEPVVERRRVARERRRREERGVHRRDRRGVPAQRGRRQRGGELAHRDELVRGRLGREHGEPDDPRSIGERGHEIADPLHRVRIELARRSRARSIVEQLLKRAARADGLASVGGEARRQHDRVTMPFGEHDAARGQHREDRRRVRSGLAIVVKRSSARHPHRGGRGGVEIDQERGRVVGHRRGLVGGERRGIHGRGRPLPSGLIDPEHRARVDREAALARERGLDRGCVLRDHGVEAGDRVEDRPAFVEVDVAREGHVEEARNAGRVEPEAHLDRGRRGRGSRGIARARGERGHRDEGDRETPRGGGHRGEFARGRPAPRRNRPAGPRRERSFRIAART
jgi:hypothetical protein